MNKRIFIVPLIFFIFLSFFTSYVCAASGVASICYCTTELPYATHMYTDSKNHLLNMGYTCRGYESNGNKVVLDCLKESKVFVAVGHAQPGMIQCSDTTYLTGTGSGTSGNYIAVANIPNGSLNNVKIALWYGCQLGSTGGTNRGNIVDVTKNKGAKLAVGWTVDTIIGEMTEWNRLFFEKAKNNTVVESFRHADYWIPILKGSKAKERMQSRHENGDIYQTIY